MIAVTSFNLCVIIAYVHLAQLVDIPNGINFITQLLFLINNVSKISRNIILLQH